MSLKYKIRINTVERKTGLYEYTTYIYVDKYIDGGKVTDKGYLNSNDKLDIKLIREILEEIVFMDEFDCVEYMIMEYFGGFHTINNAIIKDVIDKIGGK